MNISFAPLAADQTETALTLMSGFCNEMGIRFEPFTARGCLNELLANPALGQFLMINGDDGAVGYAVVTYGFNIEAGGRDGLIDELYVKPACRGMGIGTRALRYLEARARAGGLRSIYLETKRDDRKAKRFYSKLGFELREQYCLAQLDLKR